MVLDIAENMKYKYILDHFHMKPRGLKTLGYTLKMYKNNYNIFNQIEYKIGYKFYQKYS